MKLLLLQYVGVFLFAFRHAPGISADGVDPDILFAGFFDDLQHQQLGDASAAAGGVNSCVRDAPDAALNSELTFTNVFSIDVSS